MSDSRVVSWITFIGLVLVLIGVYLSVKTIINYIAFNKYPTGGVLNLNLAGITAYPQREQDCLSPQIYYLPDGRTTRPASQEEKDNEKIQQKNCLDGIKDSREQAKVNDISESLLFLFLGIGLLTTKKIFFK